MKLGILFSGGKDSCFACYKAEGEVVCLITIDSKNKESYMFHTPNIHLAKVQADAMELPLLVFETEGVKEEELKDLKNAIKEAKEKFGIEGIVTGAILSVYQSSRIKKICDDLGLECFNPLWQKEEEEYWGELFENNFEIIVVGVACDGLTEKWLGRKIDEEAFFELKKLKEKFKFHLGFEGGEAETFVVDCPLFKKKIKIIKAVKKWEVNNGIYLIKEVKLVKK
ncbi:MAG: diphthine--ammonia ligase [Nanoarchaeota archaeon]|nr:diphthine--ammonia ligase [Nanoarchaeota archaeon]MBU1444714.1 diphthine--ammonia ligase [Nanoarchaeota archaeon]MBU2406575.1 diphthine--ammonia ligase [Nanoarchaeota archaeon]MBU2420566.1 diphthine--ammonia ligase [Nanoarchaeota archaeon]MBU2475789.1 diphthine--ammonia ligase [Nanoarchaeota archaeon]